MITSGNYGSEELIRSMYPSAKRAEAREETSGDRMRALLNQLSSVVGYSFERRPLLIVARADGTELLRIDSIQTQKTVIKEVL